MPARGYEFYLRVVNSMRYRVDHSKIKFISTREHVISSIDHITMISVNAFLKGDVVRHGSRPVSTVLRKTIRLLKN